MTKVIILGDLHFGARNSNKIVEQWQAKFLDETFWPYVEQSGIKRIIQLGDYFDNRRWLNINSIAFQRKKFVQRCNELDVKVDMIIGNHDIPFKHTLENNSVNQILEHEPNFTIYDTPGVMEIDDVKFTMIPWMCKDNYDEIYETVVAGGDVCVGHFDIQGFVMHPGAISKEGLHLSDFSKWNTVWSGHYHTQSQNQNVHYLGTPYQMNWSDANSTHGFWVYDTTDRSMEFVENPHSYFHRFYWNEGCDGDPTKVKDGYVKVNVQSKKDFEAFETFVDKLNFNDPFDLRIIESYEEFSQENVQDLIELASTEALIEEYIEEVATNSNKESIKNMMINIYQEAMSIEDL